MFELAQNGIIEPSFYSPDLSVVVQQIFSSLFANRSGIPEEYFLTLFEGFCDQEELHSILRHLEMKEYIEYDNNAWYPVPKVLDMGENGIIHSNIPNTYSMQVIDIKTDKTIGAVGTVIDETFILGGKTLRLKKFRVLRIMQRLHKPRELRQHLNPRVRRVLSIGIYLMN